MRGRIPISPSTRPFAVLGHPVSHSLSPLMHNANFNALGMDAVYLAFDVQPRHLLETLRAMWRMGFGGVNITVPLKQTAYAGIRHLDVSARRMGAVNTVAFAAGGMTGYNTDGDGFLMALREEFGTGIAGLSVFILGAGGAGRAVAIAAASEKAARIVLSDVDRPKAERLGRELERMFRNCRVTVEPPAEGAWRRASLEADIVVQATPVGMKPGEKSLLPPDSFRSGQMVFDLIYMYPKTPFLKAAARAGARTANGLGMLLHQGAKAFTIWTGKNAALNVMRRTLETAVYGRGGQAR